MSEKLKLSRAQFRKNKSERKFRRTATSVVEDYKNWFIFQIDKYRWIEDRTNVFFDYVHGFDSAGCAFAFTNRLYETTEPVTWEKPAVFLETCASGQTGDKISEVSKGPAEWQLIMQQIITLLWTVHHKTMTVIL
jgi:hypothetical protein